MTASAPRQMTMALAHEAGRRLARVEVAMHALALTEDGVLCLVDRGWLIAFNVASVTAKRRELALWYRSVIAYRDRLDKSDGCQPPLWETESILADLLPFTRDLRSAEVKQLLGIKAGLLHDHLRSGLLQARPGTRAPRRGPVITRASVAQFLRARRVHP